MKKIDTVRFGLLLCCCIIVTVSGQDAIKPWEKYGISQSEWKMTKDNNISEEKLKVILSSGISVTEFCQKPWKNLGLRETDWMDKRRAGMSEYDIELEAQSNRTGYRQDNKNTMKSENNSVASKQSPGLFTSFILPGYQQQRIGQKTRGRIMSGLAIGFIACSFVGSVAEGGFEPIPLLLLVPDMFWSLFDYKITLKKREPE
jgi:hypothetical protein